MGLWGKCWDTAGQGCLEETWECNGQSRKVVLEGSLLGTSSEDTLAVVEEGRDTTSRCHCMVPEEDFREAVGSSGQPPARAKVKTAQTS